ILQLSNDPPNCATSVAPANDATGIARNPTLTWADGGNAQTYDVYFGTTSNPSFVANVTSTSYTPIAPLASNTTYYWKVIPKNINGSAVGCSEQSFTTGTEIVYCQASYTNGCSNGAKISNFATTGAIVNTSNNTGTSTCGTGGYNNFTASHQIQATADSQIDFTVGVGSYGAGVKLWADWNRNGTFEDEELL